MFGGRLSIRSALAALPMIALACGHPIGVWAQTASCPKGASSGKSITFTGTDGRRSEISWLSGDRVRISEQNAASRTFPRETIAVRGLVGIEMTRPSGKVAFQFAQPPESLFPLTVGKQAEIAYVVQTAGQPPIKARMTVAAVEALQHAIGGCTYDALLVGSVTEFEGGKQTPIRYDVYVPALQAVVKSTTFDAAANTILEAESFEFDTIASR